MDRGVVVIFTDKIEYAGFLELLLHLAVEPGKDERDRFLTQRFDQLGEHAHTRRVYMVERFGVEHQPADRRTRSGYRFANAALDVVCVGKEQPIVEAIDQHTGCGLG